MEKHKSATKYVKIALDDDTFYQLEKSIQRLKPVLSIEKLVYSTTISVCIRTLFEIIDYYNEGFDIVVEKKVGKESFAVRKLLISKLLERKKK